jgi:diaminopimelate epimerase
MMEPIPFWKMSGAGNDFILIDNRDGRLAPADQADLARAVCRRKLSVGADGLILIENSPTVDFRWRFYNADGSVAEACGNGSRCAARFAFLNGIAGNTMRFETIAGIIAATVDGDSVKVNMTDPKDLKIDLVVDLDGKPLPLSRVNTGVPHVVVPVDDLDTVDVVGLGRRLRFHPDFGPAGTNVNFVRRRDRFLAVRTYERGVEDETLACGTGCTAVAIVAAAKWGLTSPVGLTVRSGGRLRIFFALRDGAYVDVVMEGDARIIYKGLLWPEAMAY